MKSAFRLFFFLIALCAFSCGAKQTHAEENRDTANKGEITISVDESFRPLMQAQLNTFLGSNPDAKINVLYKSEADCIQDLIERKTRVAVVARSLKSEESAQLKAQNYSAEESLVAWDGIAIIAGLDNELEKLSLTQLSGILRGEISRWSQLGMTIPGSDSIVVVFDQSGSSTFRQVEGKLASGKLPSKVYAAGGNPEVVQYVQSNPAAIGFIGLNWISDADDSLAEVWRSGLNIIPLEASDSAQQPGEYFLPTAKNIGLNNYMLWREIKMITWEPYIGLGTGFVHFVAGERGQRIMEKAGLRPRTPGTRTVQFPPVENATDIQKYVKEEKKKRDE